MVVLAHKPSPFRPLLPMTDSSHAHTSLAAQLIGDNHPQNVRQALTGAWNHFLAVSWPHRRCARVAMTYPPVHGSPEMGACAVDGRVERCTGIILSFKRQIGAVSLLQSSRTSRRRAS